MPPLSPTWSDDPDADASPSPDQPVADPKAPGAPPLGVSDEEPGRYVGPDGDTPTLLGAGGMGAVYLVYDRHLAREVAKKELGAATALRVGSSGPTGSPTLVDRFLREARVTARLEHPNIVPVYEIGRARDGALYYTMRRIRGRSLADALAGASGIQDRLAYLPHYLAVCNAVAFAHSRGVVHRDLKPANIMLGEYGETLLVDWGIARLVQDIEGTPEARSDMQTLASASGETLAESVVGTPAYMSPEQAQGGEVDARSDIWSLGAILYELLTGSAPYGGEPRKALAQAVLGNVPAADRVPGVPPELAAVARRALDPQPAERYETALALANDAAAWLEGRRVEAYRYRLRDALPLYARMYRVPLAIAGIVSFVLAIGLPVLAYQRARALEAEARALAAVDAVSGLVGVVPWDAMSPAEWGEAADTLFALADAEDPNASLADPAGRARWMRRYFDIGRAAENANRPPSVPLFYPAGDSWVNVSYCRAAALGAADLLTGMDVRMEQADIERTVESYADRVASGECPHWDGLGPQASP